MTISSMAEDFGTFGRDIKCRAAFFGTYNTTIQSNELDLFSIEALWDQVGILWTVAILAHHIRVYFFDIMNSEKMTLHFIFHLRVMYNKVGIVPDPVRIGGLSACTQFQIR